MHCECAFTHKELFCYYMEYYPFQSYLTSQLHLILHRLPDWRDTSKLTDIKQPLLPPLLTTRSVPSLLRPLWMTFFHVDLGRPDLHFPWVGVHWLSLLGFSCCPYVEDVQTVAIAVCVFWWCLRALGTHIFIWGMLWPRDSQDLSLASHIKRVQSVFISFSQTPALGSIERWEDTRVVKLHLYV